MSAKTLRDFFRRYQAGGREELKTLHYPQAVSALAAHQKSIESEFRERPAKSSQAGQRPNAARTKQGWNGVAFSSRVG